MEGRGAGRQGLVEALRRGDAEAVAEAIRGQPLRAESWYELRALARKEAIRMLEGGGFATAAALSHHPDGYVREAAVHALIRFPEASLPRLVVLANDWAWPVAQVAAYAVRTVMSRASDATLQKSTHAFQTLVRGRRWDGWALAQDFLKTVKQRPGLAAKIRGASGGTLSRWLFENVRDLAESEADVVRQGLGHGDPGVQTWAARRSAAFPGLRDALHRARSARLRRLALEFAPPDVLEAALLDPDAGVRNDARFLLGERDYAALYRAALPTPGAVSGQGETGNQEDVELIRPLLDHPAVQVRWRALLALAKLAEEGAIPELTAALRSPHRRLQRAAAEALGRMAFAMDAEEAAGLDLAPATAWKVMERTPRWAGLIAVLRRVDTFPRAEAWLARWAARRRASIPPTPVEAIDATALLMEARPFLQEPTVDAVRTAIRAWIR